jgi:microcystin-dependent protein
MSEPFLAEVRIVGFNFAPRGWALCDGQILPINQNQSLYSLLGTTYGGDGRTSFALPDMRGRSPIHKGNSNTGGSNHTLGQKSGEETHQLSEAEIPQHSHGVMVSDVNGTNIGASPGNVYLTHSKLEKRFSSKNTPDVDMNSTNEVNPPFGGGQPHENMQPYLAVNFCIALTGLFPSRN